jgi:Raf kinase inhibitor-like YbhB/YbcL family protein
LPLPGAQTDMTSPEARIGQLDRRPQIILAGTALTALTEEQNGRFSAAQAGAMTTKITVQAARARRMPAWLSLRVGARRLHDGPMTLTLRSPAFGSGTSIPARFDHQRGDLSAALAWDGVPEGSAGLVLLVDDPDAPVEGSFVHWVLCNLDPARRGMAEGEVPGEATAGANGFGRPGYLGPAPPPGDAPHRYVFRLLAVDAPVSLKGLPSYQDVETAVTGHTLGEARLTGTYQR